MPTQTQPTLCIFCKQPIVLTDEQIDHLRATQTIVYRSTGPNKTFDLNVKCPTCSTNNVISFVETTP